MAQPQKPNPQAKDPYAQRTRTLTSTVQKVRGWVGSDPSRTAELADALVELTAHRSLGHAWAVAAADAQEAVKLSAQLLTANGPIGPYTAIEDAARYVTAVVQFAAVQVGLGLPEAAGRSIASLEELQEQVGIDAITRSVGARTAIWALGSAARAALAAGEVAAANAYADAAQDRLAESGLADDAESAYLVLDTDRLSADARWAAGDAEASLTYLLAAKTRYEDVAAGRLAEPARLNDGLRERLAEPLAGLGGDLADRLFAVGEQDLALAVRRELTATLRKLAERSPESNRVPLAAALASLGADLAAAGRDGEAAPLMAEAGALDSAAGSRSRSPLGASVRWEALPGRTPYVVPTPGGGRGAREADMAGAASAWRAAARAEAEESENAHRQAAATDAQRAAAAATAQRQAEADRQAREQAAADRAVEAEAEERAAAEEAEREERKRRRAERIEEHRRLEEQQEAERRAAERAAYERRVAEHGDSAEIERLELARLQAEIDELEEREQREAEAERRAAEEAEEARQAAAQAEADRLAAERDEAEESERRREESERRAVEEAEEARLAAEQVEEARRADERADVAAEERAQAERVETERVETERVETERVETEQVETALVETAGIEAAQIEAELDEDEDELVVAQRVWNEAKSRGDRRATRTANERVVELLRPRAQTDLSRYGPPLVSALEDLSRARLRGGDIFGSRGPAKEAKALAKSLGG